MLQGRELENGELESKAVQVFKVVAIVHYKVNSISVGKDGKTQVQCAGITHTWRQSNGA